MTSNILILAPAFINFFIIFYILIFHNNNEIINYYMGIGDWGLGIGVWGLG